MSKHPIAGGMRGYGEEVLWRGGQHFLGRQEGVECWGSLPQFTPAPPVSERENTNIYLYNFALLEGGGNGVTAILN